MTLDHYAHTYADAELAATVSTADAIAQARVIVRPKFARTNVAVLRQSM
jgi:hypothetical protein